MINNECTRANWENLANAIVLSAVQDFMTQYKKLLKNPKSKSAEAEVTSLVRFFTSEYYSTLTCVYGKFLVMKLKNEVEEKLNVEKRGPAYISGILCEVPFGASGGTSVVI